MAELNIHQRCQEACMNHITRYETTILVRKFKDLEGMRRKERRTIKDMEEAEGWDSWHSLTDCKVARASRVIIASNRYPLSSSNTQYPFHFWRNVGPLTINHTHSIHQEYTLRPSIASVRKEPFTHSQQEKVLATLVSCGEVSGGGGVNLMVVVLMTRFW